jgi:hypothetical protein
MRPKQVVKLRRKEVSRLKHELIVSFTTDEAKLKLIVEFVQRLNLVYELKLVDERGEEITGED